jgi:hypothetical protein
MKLFTLASVLATTLTVAFTSAAAVPGPKELSVATNVNATMTSPDQSGELMGKNCKGSYFCGDCSDIQIVWKLAQDIPDDKWYADGKKILCAQCAWGDSRSGLCLFTQKMKGQPVRGKHIKYYLRLLIDHGCKQCGSIPLNNQKVEDGELTVNFVAVTCAHGLCKD